MSGRASGGPTVRDVARAAGVSVATVSRALNDREEVRPETRAKVQAAAAELGFRLAASSRPRRTSRELTVGLITSDSVGRFSIPILLGVEDAFGAAGRVAVLLCDARGDAIRERHYLQVLADRRVDGLVVVGERTESRPPVVTARGIPVVYAYAPSADAADASFVPDHVQGARLAVGHLVALGRRRIAHITGPNQYAAAVDRRDGVLAALEDAGLQPAGDVLFGTWSAHWGRQAAALLLARQPDVDAIVCGSDQIAAGVVDALHDAGRSVPKDVAVTGFDNWEVVVTDARVPLTTVDMNLPELGRAAAERLFAAMNGSGSGGLHRQLCRLVIRFSTGPS